MCKLVGRYQLTSNFNIDTFLSNSSTFKVMKGDGRIGILAFTNFYSITRNVFNLYLEHQKIWLSKDRKQPVEHIITMFVESLPEIKLIKELNIRGIGGSTGNICYL